MPKITLQRREKRYLSAALAQSCRRNYPARSLPHPRGMTRNTHEVIMKWRNIVPAQKTRFGLG